MCRGAIFFLLAFVSIVPHRYIGVEGRAPSTWVLGYIYLVPAAVCGMLLVFWSVYIVNFGEFVKKPLYIIAGLYLVSTFLSSFSSPDILFSSSRSIYYGLTGVLVYFVVGDCFTSRSSLTFLAYFLVWIGALVACWGLVEFFTGYNPIFDRVFNLENPLYARFAGHIEEKRIRSTLGHPVFLGACLVGCIPLGIHFLNTSKTVASRILNFFCLLAMVIALFFTFSRGAWVGFGVSVWMLVKKRHGYFTLPLLIVLLLALIFLSPYLFQVAQKTYSGYIRNFFENSRVLAYDYSAHLTIQHMLLGVGSGQYPAFSHVYGATDDTPDSMYLRLLIEYGVLGLSCMILLGTLIINSLRISRVCEREEMLAVSLRSSLVGFAVDLTVCDALYFPATRILFWILCGLSVAVVRQEKAFS